MAFTKREKYVLIVAVIAVGLLLADRYILSPVFVKRTEARETKNQLQVELDQALNVLKRKKLLEEKWALMKQAGLSDSPSKTESIVLRYLKSSSTAHNLKLSSLQPERLQQDTALKAIEFLVSGVGNMSSVSRFLWDIETSEIPLKIESLQLGSRDEDGQQMTVQLKLSSIYIAPEESKESEK